MLRDYMAGSPFWSRTRYLLLQRQGFDLSNCRRTKMASLTGLEPAFTGRQPVAFPDGNRDMFGTSKKNRTSMARLSVESSAIEVWKHEWWRLPDSNRPPIACKAIALPDELSPHYSLNCQRPKSNKCQF